MQTFWIVCTLCFEIHVSIYMYKSTLCFFSKTYWNSWTETNNPTHKTTITLNPEIYTICLQSIDLSSRSKGRPFIEEKQITLGRIHISDGVTLIAQEDLFPIGYHHNWFLEPVILWSNDLNKPAFWRNLVDVVWVMSSHVNIPALINGHSHWNSQIFVWISKNTATVRSNAIQPSPEVGVCVVNAIVVSGADVLNSLTLNLHGCNQTQAVFGI